MKIDEKYFDDVDSKLNNIEDILESSEKILWRSKPNKKSYILSKVFQGIFFVLIWLAFDVTFITLMVTHMGEESGMPYAMLAFIIPFFLIHLMPVWIWIVGIIKGALELKNIEYAFTDKRIIIRSGLVGIDFKFLYYSEIESVNVRVGLIDKIFRVGDIYINAVASSAVLFDLKSPYSLGSKLQKIVQDIKADINYPNSKREEINPGYNTKYTANPFDSDKK